MGRIIINPGGAGGIDPDELTVTPEKVLAGEIFGGAGSDEPQTGTMDVQSILSFSAAPYSSKEIMFTWQNPTKGAFSGVIIIGKEGSYPENINDGTRYYKGYGDNPSANGVSSMVVDGFSGGVTYYFRAFSYALRNGAEWISGKTYTATASTKKGQQAFTSSGMFTVPDGVRFIDVFLVGGGSGGSGVYSGRCGGGGSGYTKTFKDIPTSPGQQFAVTIGAGGSGGIGGTSTGATKPTLPGNGGTTSFGEYSIGGGTRSPNASNGAGSGGSGGGWDDPGFSDGGGGAGTGADGAGQGTTTRAFGESTNTLYAGGGGGAICSGSAHNAHAGGAGGGGAGGYRYKSGMVYASAGGANTGGGGGGCAWVSFSLGAGSGGSGLVIVRWGY